MKTTRQGEDKGYNNPLITFVVAIIMWMWAAIVYLSGDREVQPFGRTTTELLKWAFGHIGGAIFLVLLGGFFLWVGIQMWKKGKRETDDWSDD